MARASDICAVFDVDETLIWQKSMFGFLRFWLGRTTDEASAARAYEIITVALRDLSRHAPREAVNRAFYRTFAGAPIADLQAAALDWYTGLDQGSLFIPETRKALDRHRDKGHRITLLSGSADFIVAPLAAEIDADHICAVTLETDDAGRCTGEITGIQTIGAGKRDALRALMSHHPARLLVGYGDHDSDAPFLAECDLGFLVSHETSLPAADWARGLFLFPIRSREGSAASASQEFANA